MIALDDASSAHELDDQALIDILRSVEPGLTELGLSYRALQSPETVLAALPNGLDALELDLLWATLEMDILEGLDLVASLVAKVMERGAT